jgi:hypothetical protein
VDDVAGRRNFPSQARIARFADPEALLKKVSVPVLWMAANDDLGTRDPSARFQLLKPTALSALVWSVSDQYSMVDVSLDQVIECLGRVNAAAPR